MAFPDKTLSIDGNDVVVSCEELASHDRVHRYLFTAKLGRFTHQHGLTIGPSDGEFIPPTAEQLQIDVDAVREIAARGVVARSQIDEVVGKVK